MNDESNALPELHFGAMDMTDDVPSLQQQIESITREKETYKDKFEIAIAVLEGKCKPMAPLGDSHNPEIAEKLEKHYQAALVVHAKQKEAIANYDTLRAELDAAKEKAARYDWLTDGNAYEHADADQPYITRQYRDSYGNNHNEILSPEDAAKEIDTARARPGTAAEETR